MNENQNKSEEISADKLDSSDNEKTFTATNSSAKKAKAIIIAAVITVIISAVVICVFFSLKKKDDEPSNDFDLNDMGFVSDADSLGIDSISDGVIGTGVLYENAEIYAQPSSESDVVGTLDAGATLLVYASEGDYYKVSDAENKISGYVIKTKLNTGGIDIGNPEAETQIVDDETGKVVSTTKKETVQKDKSGINPEDFPVNSSPYFIYVEKGSHTITIFAKDENGKYTKPVRTYSTATGRTASLTPVGNFSIKAKENWHSWGKSYSPYCSKYYGGLFFHGPLYREKNFGTLFENSVSAIGTNASSGCMRTSANAAYFIWAFCPVGTNVKIVNGSPLGRRAGRPSIKSQYIDPATNSVPTVSIKFGFENKKISVGEKFKATVDFTPESASNKLCSWESSNNNIASVSGNQNTCTVKGISAGKAVITATSADGSHKASFTVYVIDNTPSEVPTSNTNNNTSATSSTTPEQPSTASSENTSSAPPSTTSAQNTEPKVTNTEE